MSPIKTLIFIAPLALATAALASPDRYSDAQYIAAARCQALATSSALGPVDTDDINAVMKIQSQGRAGPVLDRADEARADADRAARHAGAYSKAGLIAERDGSCRALLAGATMSAAAEPHGATRTN